MDEFTEVFGGWLTDAVQLHVYSGAGFAGETWAAPVPAPGLMVEDKRRQVRAASGSVVLSETTLYVPPGSPQFTPGDKVTLPTGREAVVLVVVDHAVGGLFAHSVVNVE